MGQVGIFLRAVVRQKASKQASDLSLSWMGANLQKKGLEEVLQKLDLSGVYSGQKKKEVTPAHATAEFKRLRGFMSGRR